MEHSKFRSNPYALLAWFVLIDTVPMVAVINDVAGSTKTGMTTNSFDSSEDYQILPEDAGALAVWGTRGLLLDLNGGFFTLREQMTREVGPEFTADILYRAGFAGSSALMAFLFKTVGTNDRLQVLQAALTQLSAAGHGSIQLDQRQDRPGEVRLRADNSAEGTLMRGRPGRTGGACDYLRGLLRGIVEALPPGDKYPSGELECVEISCLANDDPHCRFLVATPDHLAQHGYRSGNLSHSSVRETLLRLNRQLEDVLEAAKRDTLTGLFNRAHFESVLRSRIEQSKRHTDTLSVAMIDLDGFKEVNDGMGHAMGDLALRQVGHLLGAQARDTDVAARYGGDEFAWLMPGTSVEAAVAVADRIRRLVRDMSRDLNLPISLSVGIASCPGDASSMTDLIDFADAAMYQAKGAGGNQVRRYVAAEDDRTAGQKLARTPRSRPAADTDEPSASSDELPQLDLED